MSLFPVEINRADYEMLLRVPGIGVRSAKKIIMARKVKSLSFEDLKKLGVVLKRANSSLPVMASIFSTVTWIRI